MNLPLWLKRTVSQNSQAARKQRSRYRSPSRVLTITALETLETRALLSTVSVELSGGVATINGSDTADSVVVDYASDALHTFAHVNGVSHNITGAQSILFVGGSGNDVFRNNTSIDSVIMGGLGDDTLIGGLGDDTFTWSFGDGDDSVSGDAGRNTLSISGSTSNGNSVTASDSTSGHDFEVAVFEVGTLASTQSTLQVDSILQLNIAAFAHNDRINRNALPEIDELATEIRTGGGRDVVFGSNAADHIYGEDGPDLIIAGGGNDIIDGGAGNDSVFGGGDDIVDGGEDDDGIYWRFGDGDDSLSGGAGHNTLHAASPGATPNLVVARDSSMDADFEILWQDAGLPESTAELLQLHSFHVLDVSTSSSAADEIRFEQLPVLPDLQTTIRSSGGDDIIFGSSGVDHIFGGSEDDTIRGGGGNDIINGGGHDVFHWSYGDGDDSVDGGDGENTLSVTGGSSIRNMVKARTSSTEADFEVLSRQIGYYDSSGDLLQVNSVQHLNVTTFALADEIQMQDLPADLNLKTRIRTGDGADTMFGSRGADDINGQGGNDQLNGGGGNDVFHWSYGDGDDSVDGGDGHNTLNVTGESSIRNMIKARTSSTDADFEVLSRQIGYYDSSGNLLQVNSVQHLNVTTFALADEIQMQDLPAGLGLQTEIRVGGGDDTVFGSPGVDNVWGGAGGDQLNGGGGHDVFHWSYGDDDDSVDGGDGENTLSVTGESSIRNMIKARTSSTDADFEVLSRQIGYYDSSGDLLQVDSVQHLNVTTFALADEIQMQDLPLQTEIRVGGGDDAVFGSSGVDYIWGGAGNDRIDGGGGADMIDGGYGDDLISGGLGNDEIEGGFGHDQIWGDMGSPEVSPAYDTTSPVL